MKVRHLRTGREMKLGNVLTFMANERVASEDAVAGDIIGIHNHGQLQIGDTLTEGEALGFKGIPYFAPELFRVARPARSVQGEAAAEGPAGAGRGRRDPGVRDASSATRCCSAPSGQLQFEIVAHRLATEYKVDAIYETRGHLDRALAHVSRRRPCAATSSASSAASLATDVDGNPVFLATNKYNLQVTMERWPQVGFHATREHGRTIAQG